MTIWAFLRSSGREIFLPQRWVIAPHCLRNVGGRPKGKYTTLRHCTRVVTEFNPSVITQRSAKHFCKSSNISKLESHEYFLSKVIHCTK